MIFDIQLGNVGVYDNHLRVILRKPICNRSQFDTVSRSITCYLANEGFFLTPMFAGNDVKNLLFERVVTWKLELYDDRGNRIVREKCPA